MTKSLNNSESFTTSLNPSLALEQYLTLTKELKRRQGIKALKAGDFAIEKLKPLINREAVYLAAYGGRGGAKSYFFADLHWMRALNDKTYHALCLRQVQKSIEESSKKLLTERAHFWGINKDFDFKERRILGDGVKFAFHGLQDHTSESIKSFEGFDVADIEEGQTIGQHALNLLVPTIIRKKGAQIWCRWNPRNETDAVDLLFRGEKPPPRSVVVEVSWKDNPHLNDEMKEQIEADYDRDPEQAAHIWAGQYARITEGAYYSRQMAKVEREGRVGDYPYRPELPVITSWDIGVDDYTAIWFWQIISSTQVNLIDYYEASGIGAEDIVLESMPETLTDLKLRQFGIEEITNRREVPFNRYEKHHLPHDVANREWGAGAKRRSQTLTELGVMPVITGAQLGPVERVNASRQLLSICHFNERTTKLGVKRLWAYSRKKNKVTGQYGGPLKDGNDHCADAFGEYAVNCPILPQKTIKPPPPKPKGYGKHRKRKAAAWR